MRIRISWAAEHLTATLDETPTSKALAGALPLTSTALTCDDEVYFDTPPPWRRTSRQVVEPGTWVLSGRSGRTGPTVYP
ncbi:cyclophilin-like family protein [Streptomyces sp.]|uniref:cyclophilin-like family protein n=1 Tax=Streptomyces sp. TaxID=1931 RepID=UPI002D78CA1D|nr:cyclophilin-like family protein [Streptomyces sp.]HET6357688.1 cyclophilin-like family protein [Streptomyces sp.]